MGTIDRGRERGASLAEVALVIALIAVVVVGAVSALGSSSGSTFDEAGSGIHEGGETSGTGTGGGPGGGGGSGGGGDTGGPGGPVTGPGSTTTSTPPPAPTTTVPAPTTTVTVPPASAALANGRGVRSGSSRWEASADLHLDAGRGVAGTVMVRVRSWRASGQVSVMTMEVPVDADGHATITSGPYARTGSSRITEVEYTVIDVDLDDGGTWDGGQATITIDRPA